MATPTFAKGYVVTIDGVSIAKITNDGIPIPKVKTEKIPTVNQDTGDFNTSIPGRKEGGTVTLKAMFDQDDTGQGDLIDAWAAGTTCTFTVTLPGGLATWTYDGWISDLGTPAGSNLVMLEATIEVTGEATYSTTDATLTTPFFVVSGAGTVIVPAASGTGGSYVVNIATGVTSVTITPTSSSGTITVDGSTVTSGAASSAITLGAAGSITTSVIKVTEANKAATIYTLLLTRAAT